jgi:6-phosphogluconolactonase (cycloisomerase 2 family)
MPLAVAAAPRARGIARHVGAARFSLAVSGTHYVYVNNGSSPNSISGYKATSSGLTPLPGSPYVTGGSGGGSGYGGNQLAISPDDKCLFASDDGGGTFNAFAINADGSLTQVTHATVEALNVQAVAVSPKGGVVFVGMFNGYSSGPVDSFSIGSGCAITEVQHIDIGAGIGSIAVSSDGSKLFVSSYTNGFIDTYAISGTSLSLLQSNPANPTSPDGLASVGSYLFSGDATGSTAETGAYTFTSWGVLTSLPGSPAMDPQGVNAAQVWVDRAHKQLIDSEQFSNSFEIYRIKSGSYTFLAHAAGTGTSNPTAMTQLGNYILVTNDSNGTISPCKVGAGTLSCLSPIALPAFGTPNGIASF